MVQNKKQISGGHCSNFKNGSKLDCTSSDSKNSIILHLVSENVYEGTIKSGFLDAIINSVLPLIQTIILFILNNCHNRLMSIIYQIMFL